MMSRDPINVLSPFHHPITVAIINDVKGSSLFIRLKPSVEDPISPV
jgi:hypothetical protein